MHKHIDCCYICWLYADDLGNIYIHLFILLWFIYVIRELQLGNVEIIVADISTFEMEGSYDRILSIEMFEVLNAS